LSLDLQIVSWEVLPRMVTTMETTTLLGVVTTIIPAAMAQMTGMIMAMVRQNVYSTWYNILINSLDNSIGNGNDILSGDCGVCTGPISIPVTIG
jgi:hypothetical protein